MKQMPEALFFDLDGTLIDTAPDFIRVVNQLRQEESLAPLPSETIRAVVSDGSRAMIRTGLGVAESDPAFEPLRQRLLDAYLAGVADESRLFEGMEGLLARLEERGIPWGIVTNKPRLYSEALLDALGLTPRLASLVCAGDLPRSKPHPDPLLKAASDSQVDPRTCWYVGDHIRDIEAGRAAGMGTVAAAYGYLSAEPPLEQWEADHVIHRVADLSDLLFSETFL